MCSDCENTDVPSKQSLRIVGALTVILAIIQISFTAIAYEFLDNVNVGGWWAGAMILLTGMLLLSSSNRGYVISALVISIIAIILCLIALVVDFIAWGSFNDLATCTNEDKEIFGDELNTPSCLACLYHTTITRSPQRDYDCYCVFNNDIANRIAASEEDEENVLFSECWKLNIHRKDGSDCDLILSEYPNMLQDAFLSTLFAFMMLIIASCMTCCSRLEQVRSVNRVLPVTAEVEVSPVCTGMPVNSSTQPYLATVTYADESQYQQLHQQREQNLERTGESVHATTTTDYGANGSDGQSIIGATVATPVPYKDVGF